MVAPFAPTSCQARYLCSETQPLRSRVEENYKAYLSGMAENDWYRRAYHLPVYRALRKVRRLFPKRA